MGQRRLHNDIFPHRSEHNISDHTGLQSPCWNCEVDSHFIAKIFCNLVPHNSNPPKPPKCTPKVLSSTSSPQASSFHRHLSFLRTYSISLAANKNASIPLLFNAPAEQFDASVTLLSPPVGCVTRPTYQNDTNQARSGLNAWCNAGNVVLGTSAEFLSYTSAIAYICNYSGPTNHCSSAEFDVASQLLNADCGGSSAAWVKIDAWAKGYRRDNKSVQICAWGLGTGRDRNPGDFFLFV